MDATTMITMIIAIAGAATGATGTYISLRKQKVEEGSSAVDAWRTMVAPLREELDELRIMVDSQSVELQEHKERIRMLEAENIRLAAGVHLLTNQIRANGMIPVWEPEPEPEVELPATEPDEDEQDEPRRHRPPGRWTRG